MRDEKPTGKPDDDVASKGSGNEPSVQLRIDAKLIVWLPLATAKLWSTLAAALYTALPACAALTVHVPTVRNTAVLPPTKQIVGVCDDSMTGSPEEAVAASSNGALDTVCAMGGAKLIV